MKYTIAMAASAEKTARPTFAQRFPRWRSPTISPINMHMVRMRAATAAAADIVAVETLSYCPRFSQQSLLSRKNTVTYASWGGRWVQDQWKYVRR
jgi:hypothetical protein